MKGKGEKPPDPLDMIMKPGRATVIRIESHRDAPMTREPEVMVGRKRMKDPGPALRALGADNDALNFIVGVLKGTAREVKVDRFGEPFEVTPGFKEKFQAAEFIAKYLWAPLPKQLEVTGADGGPIQTEQLEKVSVETLRDVWRKLGASPAEVEAQISEVDEG